MRNTTTTAKNRIQSKFLGQRRKRRLLAERPVLSKNFNFLKDNKGTVSSNFMEGGIVKCIFSSYTTQRAAFAFGPTFDIAYVNMIKRFNEKYPNHG